MRKRLKGENASEPSMVRPLRQNDLSQKDRLHSKDSSREHEEPRAGRVKSHKAGNVDEKQDQNNVPKKTMGIGKGFHNQGTGS